MSIDILIIFNYSYQYYGYTIFLRIAEETGVFLALTPCPLPFLGEGRVKAVSPNQKKPGIWLRNLVSAHPSLKPGFS
jgi:hypothetical protein